VLRNAIEEQIREAPRVSKLFPFRCIGIHELLSGRRIIGGAANDGARVVRSMKELDRF
jgi:hypothetical protein